MNIEHPRDWIKIPRVNRWVRAGEIIMAEIKYTVDCYDDDGEIEYQVVVTYARDEVGETVIRCESQEDALEIVAEILCAVGMSEKTLP